MLEIIVLLTGQTRTALNETSGISQMSMGTENKSAERFFSSVLTREAECVCGGGVFSQHTNRGGFCGHFYFLSLFYPPTPYGSRSRQYESVLCSIK